MIGPLLTRLGRVSSTNDVVRDAILSGAPHGYAVWAEEQTGGRGRFGRTWYAAAGESLPLSIAVVGPRWRPRMTLLPLAAAVGTARAISTACGVVAGIKWPNDLLVGDKKICGILCEAVVDRDGVRGAVVGIGINVNLDPAFAPDELRGRITSIWALTDRRVDLDALAAAVRTEVLREVESLEDGGVSMLSRWRAGSVTLGRQVATGTGEARVEGVAVDVAEDGGLVVRCGDGSTRVVRSGEVAVEDG